MKTTPIILQFIVISGLLLQAAHHEERGADYPDPARFEEAIAEFEAMDAEEFPPEGAILFYGSSSIRRWHEQLPAVFAPLEVIPRGFGGSTMLDALYYADRVVLPYKPRAIVFYEGDNDTNGGVAPEKILETFDRFLEKVHGNLPDCHIYFLSIKPSPKRWHLWHDVVEPLNQTIRERCEAHPLMTYVDVAAPMILDDGELDPSIFVEDGVHTNREGYERWRLILRPLLLQRELN